MIYCNWILGIVTWFNWFYRQWDKLVQNPCSKHINEAKLLQGHWTPTWSNVVWMPAPPRHDCLLYKAVNTFPCLMHAKRRSRVHMCGAKPYKVSWYTNGFPKSLTSVSRWCKPKDDFRRQFIDSHPLADERDYLRRQTKRWTWPLTIMYHTQQQLKHVEVLAST